jgi:hypothetical protein
MNITNRVHFLKFIIFVEKGVYMKRIIAVFMVLLGLASFLMAQTAEEEIIRIKQETEGVLLEEAENEAMKEEKWPGQWNFSVGTSYSYIQGYGSGMMFYTAPSYTLPLNDRWALHGGLIAGHYVGLNQLSPAESLLPGSFSSLSVFAAASYRMNDRLVLHGAGVKQLIQGPITPYTFYPMDDLSLGASYKIGDNLTIGASVHMRNSNGYYHVPTLGSPFFPSTLGW